MVLDEAHEATEKTFHTLYDDVMYKIFEYLSLPDMAQCRAVNKKLYYFTDHYMNRYGTTFDTHYFYKLWLEKFEQQITAAEYLGAVLRRWGEFVHTCCITDKSGTSLMFDSNRPVICAFLKKYLVNVKELSYNIIFPRNIIRLNMSQIKGLDMSAGPELDDEQLEEFLMDCKDTLESLLVNEGDITGECLKHLINLKVLTFTRVPSLEFELLIECIARNPNLENFQYCLHDGHADIDMDQLCTTCKELKTFAIGPIFPTMRNATAITRRMPNLTALTVKFTESSPRCYVPLNIFLQDIIARNKIQYFGVVMPSTFRLLSETLLDFKKFTSLKMLSLESIWNFNDLYQIIDVLKRVITLQLVFQEVNEAQFQKNDRNRRPKFLTLVKLMDVLPVGSAVELNHFPLDRIDFLEAFLEICFASTWTIQNSTYTVN